MAKKEKHSPKDLVASIITFIAGVFIFITAMFSDGLSAINIVISLCFIILGFYFIGRYTNPRE